MSHQSSLKWLEVKGVRSFDPNKTSKIEFGRPLTLLHGPNGAGKTTIIECLKYATTNKRPMNIKKEAFVHNLKAASLQKVEAKVRLKCATIYGDEVVVERRMTAVADRKGETSFKIDDGLFTTIKNGQETSTACKSSELDTKMVTNLGVSKAILDHVIFCHQERSNWPLSEGSSLKDKFNEIFATTGYNTALEQIRNIRKSRIEEKKTEETEQKHLKTYHDRASGLKSELTTAKSKLSDVRQRKKEILDESTDTCARLKKLSEKNDEVIELKGKLSNLKIRKDQMIREQENQKSKINNLLHGTREQLVKDQENLENILTMSRKDQENCQRRIESLHTEIRNFTSEKATLLEKQRQLKQEVEKAAEKRRSQSQLIQKIVKDSKLNVSFAFVDELSSNEVEEFEMKFNNFKSNQLKEMENKKTALELKLNQAEKEYQDHFEAKVKLTGANEQTKKTLEDSRKDLNEAKKEFELMQSTGGKLILKDLEQQVEKAIEELKEAEATANKSDENELKEMTRKKDSLDAEMKAVDNELMENQRTVEIRSKIELLETNKTTKEVTLDQIKTQTQEPLSQLSGLSTRTGFPNESELSSWIDKKEQDLQHTQQECKGKKSDLSKLSAELEFKSKQMKEKRTRSAELDATLFEICGSQDLDQDLTRLETDIKKLQEKKGLRDGIQHMYKKFIADMTRTDVKKKDVTCPLCQRLFDKISEVDDLISNLEEKLEVENHAKELEEKQARHMVLLKNMPLKTELNRLNTEIPELETTLKHLHTQAKQLEQRTEELEVQYIQLREDSNIARNYKGEVARVDDLRDEIGNITKDLNKLRAELPAGAREKSIEDLQETQKNVASRLQKINEAIEEQKTENQRKNDRITKLKNQVNEAKIKKLELASNTEKFDRLVEEQKSLSKEIDELESKMDKNGVQLAQLSDNVDKAVSRKDEVFREKDKATIEMNKTNQELEAKLHTLETVNKEIQQLNKLELDQKLKQTGIKIDEIEKNINEAGASLQQTQQQVGELQDKLKTCGETQIDLEKNIALQERKKEMEKVKEEIREIEKNLKEMDVAELERETKQLNERGDTLNEERGSLVEKEKRYQEEGDKLKKDLNKAEHINAEQKYRECLINCSVLEFTIEDLEKYYKALDWSITQYHKNKMEEINKIIKKLWRETYSGSDIDFIEICSDEDSGSSDSRRVYNYRVVRHSSGTAMDMRNRCSAGQKVLASLVIRLALAETFCINCGILALDEPTTNLDSDNIKSLAESLQSLIDSRSKQRNFQLIIITHDEDFVDLLGQSKYVDHFYRIEKDDRCHSTINLRPIHEIIS